MPQVVAHIKMWAPLGEGSNLGKFALLACGDGVDGFRFDLASILNRHLTREIFRIFRTFFGNYVRNQN